MLFRLSPPFYPLTLVFVRLAMIFLRLNTALSSNLTYEQLVISGLDSKTSVGICDLLSLAISRKRSCKGQKAENARRS
jgi:hypothetical protein